MQALISLHHPQDLERTAKHTDRSKDSLRLNELWSGMCVIPSLACPLQGPWDLVFMIGPLEATLKPSMGPIGFPWTLNVMLRKVTRNQIISWWKVLENKRNLRAPDVEAHNERGLSKAKPSVMKHQPSKEPWSSRPTLLSPSTGKTKADEME